MAYYLGKGVNKPLDRDIFDLFRQMRQVVVPSDGTDTTTTGTTTTGTGTTTTGTDTDTTIPTTPETTTDIITETISPNTTENYADALLKSMFGLGFEDIMRGRGAGARESVYDVLAREGLLGTGAAKGVAQEMAWGTERGVSDVLRGIEQVKYQREQDAINRLLSLLFNLMGGWQ